MMRRYLILPLVALLSWSTVTYAKMTDKEVMQYVVQQQEAGVGQEEIARQLMKKGVTVQQLSDIRAKYGKQMNKNQGRIADRTIERMRKGYSARAERNAAAQSRTTQGIAMKDESIKSIMVGELDGLIGLDSLTYYKGHRVYGRDVFNNNNLTFEPNMNIATPADYRLGAGDELIIDIYGASQKTLRCPITPDGAVIIEGIGPVRVAGITVDEANKRLGDIVGQRYASSQISVTVGQTRTITVNVMGEVVVPGTYTLSSFASVFHALYSAGGVSELGTLRSIKVFRGGKVVQDVDVYDFMLNGKTGGDMRLQDDDVVMVGAYDCLVQLTGKVKRPMIYEMKSTETLEQMLGYAGGFSAQAYTKSVRVVRNGGSQRTVFNLDEAARKTFMMADGDSVSVDSVLNRFQNMVEVKGAVFRPGMYQLGSEIKSVKTLLDYAEGVTEEAMTARGLLHRMKKDRTLEVMALNIEGILDGSVADVELKENDVLFIPLKQEVANERTLHIEGDVVFPGDYAYADNTTIEDLILQAGGLRDGVSMSNVVVSRRKYDPRSMEASEDLTETFTLEIKDGFVVDGDSGFVLKPYDRVFLHHSPNYAIQKSISIYGEIPFPGRYTLDRKDERLSDLVKKAGGLTSFAYVGGARLTRRLTQEERDMAENIQRIFELNARTGEESEAKEAYQFSSTYFVGIDLKKALENPGGPDDILLRDGDMIDVPPFTFTVKISGQVMYPNTVSFKDGKSLKYYIEQAGGFSNRAKKRKAYVINMNGTVMKAKKKNITPGCEIAVPQKPIRERMNVGQWLSIGTTSASMLAVIAALLR